MSAIKNEKMNQSLYFLSILSAIFLPLNLIVGFFGINTNDLFLAMLNMQLGMFLLLYVLFY